MACTFPSKPMSSNSTFIPGLVVIDGDEARFGRTNPPGFRRMPTPEDGFSRRPIP
jgi:hypothetical protein